jgi:thymidylate synthase
MSLKGLLTPQLTHVYNSANEAWRSLLSDISSHGFEANPRGMKTLELLGSSRTFFMVDPIVTVARRELGYRFMAAEAAWILSGDDRVETIAPFSKEIGRFSDDGVTFFGAYGPKVVSQLKYVTDTLAADPDSRQAVINIWRENPPGTKDVPCTLSLQFLLRSGGLHCIATMRSSDAWLGWPYDVFNFTMITWTLALLLAERNPESPPNLRTMTLRAGSQHLYEKNWSGAVACCNETDAMSIYTPLRITTGLPWDDPDQLRRYLWWCARSSVPPFSANSMRRFKTADKGEESKR